MTVTAPALERPTVNANMGLVIKVAKRYRWACDVSLEFDDLIQVGAIGLMTACARFEPERGFAFSTYAMHWIRHYIARAIMNQGRTIRVPVWAQEKLRREGRSMATILRLDSPLHANDPNGPTYLDTLTTPADADERLDTETLRERLAASVAKLPARMRETIKQRFWEDKTLAEVGAPWGVTRERARQIEALGLDRLRRDLAQEGIER